MASRRADGVVVVAVGRVLAAGFSATLESAVRRAPTRAVVLDFIGFSGFSVAARAEMAACMRMLEACGVPRVVGVSTCALTRMTATALGLATHSTICFVDDMAAVDGVIHTVTLERRP